MMDQGEVQTAIGQHLVSLGLGLPIVFENAPAGLPEKPFLVLEIIPVATVDPTLTGVAPVSSGFAVVTVVSDLGAYATAALELAGNIAAGFPKTWRATIAGGTVGCTKPAFIGRGYRDDVSWRIPVRIDYEAS